MNNLCKFLIFGFAFFISFVDVASAAIEEKFYIPGVVSENINFQGGSIDGSGMISGNIESIDLEEYNCSDRIIFMVFRVDEDGSENIITNKNGSKGYTIRTNTSGRLQVIHHNGSSWTSAFDAIELGKEHVLVWQHTGGSSKIYLDGEEYATTITDCIASPSKYYLNSSSPTSSVLSGGVYLFYESENLDFDKAFLKYQRLLERRIELDDNELVVDFPQSKSTLQIQDNGKGIVRVKGFVAEGINDVDVSIGADNFVCNTPERVMDCQFEMDPGIYDVKIETGDAEKLIEDVRVGNVYFVMGQSNAWRTGSLPNQTGLSDSALYSNLFPFEGVKWHAAFERSWHPRFMQTEYCGYPNAVVRHAVGSSTISSWVDSLGDYYVRDAMRELAKSQGVEYFRLHEQKLAGVALWQHGETDARQNTNLTAYENDLIQFSSELESTLDIPLYVSLLQNIYDSGYATQQSVEDIRQAHLNVVSSQENVFLGPDFSDVIFTTANNVHPGAVGELDLLADRWSSSIGIGICP